MIKNWIVQAKFQSYKKNKLWWTHTTYVFEAKALGSVNLEVGLLDVMMIFWKHREIRNIRNSCSSKIHGSCKMISTKVR